jgi:acetyl-CoA acetyltransferase
MKDLDKPTESSEQRAERMWRNNQLRQKIIASNASSPVVADPNARPEVGTVLENKAKRRPGGFERKFLKEVRSILDERKQQNLEIILAGIRHERRILMLEKIRRLELSIARKEAILAQRQKNADEGQMDLFA